MQCAEEHSSIPCIACAALSHPPMQGGGVPCCEVTAAQSAGADRECSVHMLRDATLPFHAETGCFACFER